MGRAPVGIVIVAHGALADALLATLQYIVGDLPRVRTVSFGATYDLADKTDEIIAAADSVDAGTGVIVVTDLYGGTPSNLSMRACQQSDRRILSGANVPMLVTLAKSRHLTAAEAAAAAMESGRKYITAVDVRGCA